MYIPAAFAMDEASVEDVVGRIGFGYLVSHDASEQAPASGFITTPLPFVVDGRLERLRAHLSRANPHWRVLDGADAIVVIPGGDAYITPRWYATKAETGKVVPTWNYQLVTLHGTVTVHDDADWVRALVEELTDTREASEDGTDRPWAVADAPDDYIANQLKAIVGIELHVTQVEAKEKLSQNRSEADRAGVIAGLDQRRRGGDAALAARMQRM